MSIFRNSVCPEIIGIEGRRDRLGFEDGPQANDIHSISLCAVAPNDKLSARKITALIFRVVVVEVLATKEEDPAIVELNIIVRSFIVELLDLERSSGAVSLGQKHAVLFEFSDVRSTDRGVEQNHCDPDEHKEKYDSSRFRKPRRVGLQPRDKERESANSTNSRYNEQSGSE